MSPPRTYDLYAMEEDSRHCTRFSVSILHGFHTAPLYGPGDPCADIWSLEEDGLLVQCDMAQQFDEEISEEYARAAAAQPTLFNKEATPELLRGRISQMKAGGDRGIATRYKLILKSLSSTGLKDDRCDVWNSTLTGKPAYTRRRDLPAHDMEILCDDGKTVPANSTILSTHSLRAAAEFESSGKPPPGPNGIPRLELLHSLTPLPECDVYGACASATVQQFVNLISAPDLDKARQGLQDTLDSLTSSEADLWDEVCGQQTAARDAVCGAIEAMRVSELENLRSACSSALESDISSLRALYASHVKRQEALVHERYSTKLVEVETLFATQQGQLRRLYTAFDETVRSIDALKDEISNITSTLSNLHKPSSVPRLLILSEILQAGSVRMSLVESIASNPLPFLQHPASSGSQGVLGKLRPAPGGDPPGSAAEEEALAAQSGSPVGGARQRLPPSRAMACELIRSATLMHVLSKLELGVLLLLLQDPDSSALPCALLNKEYAARLTSFEAELKHLGTAELVERSKEAARPGAPAALRAFRRAITAEVDLRERGEANGSPDTKVRMVSTPASTSSLGLSPAGLAVELLQQGRFATAVASHGRREHDAWGCCYFEVSIDKLDRFLGSFCSIGIEAVRVTACTLASSAVETPASRKLFQAGSARLTGLCPSETGMYGCAFTSDGMLHTKGMSEDAGVTLATGDVVGVLLDQTAGLCSFTKNGVAVGRATDVELDRQPSFHVAPCATLFSPNLRQKPKVTFVFSEPFRFPPESYVPYVNQF